MLIVNRYFVDFMFIIRDTFYCFFFLTSQISKISSQIFKIFLIKKKKIENIKV